MLIPVLSFVTKISSWFYLTEIGKKKTDMGHIAGFEG
jgi:hypothetical protein